MSGQQEQENVSSCDIKRLKDFVSEQKNLIVVVEKDGCQRCEWLEKEIMPRFLNRESPEVAVAQVRLRDNDQQCDMMAEDLNVFGQVLPLIITYKDGAELERGAPTGETEKDLASMNTMAAKVKQ